MKRTVCIRIILQIAINVTFKNDNVLCCGRSISAHKKKKVVICAVRGCPSSVVRMATFSMKILGLDFGIGSRGSFLDTIMIGWGMLLIERRNSITMSQRSRAGNLSIRSPASRKMISDSVELCDTELCWAMLTDLSCKFVDRPQNVQSSDSCQVQTFQDNFVSKPVTIIQLIRILLPRIGGHPSKDLKLCRTAPLSRLSVQNVAIFEHVLPCRRTKSRFFLREPFPPKIFSVTPAEIRDSNIFVCRSIIASLRLHSRWAHPKYTWSRNDVGSSRSKFWDLLYFASEQISFVPNHSVNKFHICKIINVLSLFHKKVTITSDRISPIQNRKLSSMILSFSSSFIDSNAENTLKETIRDFWKESGRNLITDYDNWDYNHWWLENCIFQLFLKFIVNRERNHRHSYIKIRCHVTTFTVI